MHRFIFGATLLAIAAICFTGCNPAADSGVVGSANGTGSCCGTTGLACCPGTTGAMVAGTTGGMPTAGGELPPLPDVDEWVTAPPAATAGL